MQFLQLLMLLADDIIIYDVISDGYIILLACQGVVSFKFQWTQSTSNYNNNTADIV